MGVAAVEAISNDALISIYELLTDTWPSDFADSEPWIIFRGRSEQPIVSMVNHRGNLLRKTRYLLGHLRRITGDELEDLERNLAVSVQARNRIVHMAYLLRPRLASPVLEPRQVRHLARLAVNTAADYIDLIDETFSEIGLPISTIRYEEDLLLDPRELGRRARAK